MGVSNTYAPKGANQGRRGCMARDRFHGTVRRALEKDGWRITADPYIVRFDRTAVEIDLAAEQLLAAERNRTVRGTHGYREIIHFAVLSAPRTRAPIFRASTVRVMSNAPLQASCFQ